MQSTAWRALLQHVELMPQYQDFGFGKRNNRPKLAAALAACKKHKAKLIIAKLDRLSRNLAFIATRRCRAASAMRTPAFGHHEDRTPTHGDASTRKAAMAAFAKSWRRKRRCAALDQRSPGLAAR
jgi:hypothetical protein